MNAFVEELPKRSGFNAHDRTRGNDEWLTPPEIIQALGPFDLDPCAPKKRPWPTAATHYTVEDNGLLKPWFGRVWLNPPYGRGIERWLARAVEHKNVTALIFARTETEAFFRYVWPHATAVCFLRGRLRFCSVDGKRGGHAGAPSVLVAFDDVNGGTLEAAARTGKIGGRLIHLR
jgi:hypothetical protein